MIFFYGSEVPHDKFIEDRTDHYWLLPLIRSFYIHVDKLEAARWSRDKEYDTLVAWRLTYAFYTLSYWHLQESKSKNECKSDPTNRFI